MRKMLFAASVSVFSVSLLAGVLRVASASSVVPPSANTGPVTSVTPASADLSATVNPNGAATTWYFEYGPAPGPYTTSTPVVSAGSGTADIGVSRTVSGLKPATSYDYRIVAQSSGGKAYGSNGIFNTSAAPSVTTENTTNITDSSANLNAVVNPEGLATKWYFDYGLTTGYGSRTAAQTIAAGPNDVNVRFSVGGLTSNSTYHFRIVATSSAGTTAGSDRTFVTGLAVTLNSSVGIVVYGGAVTLSGAIASQLPGKVVSLFREQFDQSSFSSFASVLTGSGGLWSFPVQPTARTTYEAVANNGTSSPLVIGVRPAVYLRTSSGGHLWTRVVGGISFASHVLQLQRLSGGLWVEWKHVRLNNGAQASFTTSLPRGRTMIRMAIGPLVQGLDQAAPGYLAGFSRQIAYLHP